jgi:hypothetical protein
MSRDKCQILITNRCLAEVRRRACLAVVVIEHLQFCKCAHRSASAAVPPVPLATSRQRSGLAAAGEGRPSSCVLPPSPGARGHAPEQRSMSPARNQGRTQSSSSKGCQSAPLPLLSQKLPRDRAASATSWPCAPQISCGRQEPEKTADIPELGIHCQPSRRPRPIARGNPLPLSLGCCSWRACSASCPELLNQVVGRALGRRLIQPPVANPFLEHGGAGRRSKVESAAADGPVGEVAPIVGLQCEFALPNPFSRPASSMPMVAEIAEAKRGARQCALQGRPARPRGDPAPGERRGSGVEGEVAGAAGVGVGAVAFVEG